MLKKTVILPASKSESNRALMIAAYGGFAPNFQNLSDSNDTRVLMAALHSAEQNEPIIDIADCGTAARFMVTYLATYEGDWVLTGTNRMLQRPIKPLVDALILLGANIQYVEEEGFLPLRIIGRPLLGGKVPIDMTHSSQFASSLVMAAPMWPQGIELELRGKPSSFPYFEMTLAMMRYFSSGVEIRGDVVVVRPKPYQHADFTVSADWTAASYWYEIAALSENCEIRLKSLNLFKGKPSLQGDAVIAEWMQSLGVCTTMYEEGLVLSKVPFEKQHLTFDFTHHPDLYPTIVATCAALGVKARFTGLETLHLKESDRVEAMQTELAKVGDHHLRFCAHNDHRVVMALAPLALRFGPVSFDHPEVVEKSYPNFWQDIDFQ